MTDGFGFFALAFRQRYITRWSLMHSVERESLSEHSAQCAMIAHCLAEINKTVFKGEADPEKTALYALYHDCAEVLCGDLPTPVKYATLQMRQTYAEIEKNSASALLDKLPDELKGAYSPLLNEECDELTLRLLKTADKLCALIKCETELKSGNAEFSSAKKTTLKLLEAYASPELDYFMENFFPAFSKTLDEL